MTHAKTILLTAALLCAAVAVHAADEGDRPGDDHGCLAAAKARHLALKNLNDVAEGTLGYDVRHWRLDVTVDPVARTFGGTVFVRFAPLTDLVDGFVLDSSGLAIRGVEHHSGALDYTAAGDSLVIDLPVGQPGAAVMAEDSLTVTFEGLLNPVGEFHGNGFSVTPWTEGDGLAVDTMSQPEWARTWWPTKDRPGDKATVEISVTVPSGWSGVSLGRLAGVTDNGDGTDTWSWVTEHAVSTYLVSLAVSEYVHFGEICHAPLSGNIPFEHWVYPHDEADAREDFSNLCDMMAFMENTVGAYPFADEKYGHAEFMSMRNGAMEHQTLTSYGHGLIRGDQSYDWVMMHELAHQWFGDSVGPASWKDIWLNAGFATYFEALWHEHLNGFDGDQGYLWYMDDLLWRTSLWEGYTPVYDAFPILDRVVYNKGAWILHMLRGRMRIETGDDTAFFQLLSDWANDPDNAGGTATTQDFITMASIAVDRNLDSFLWPYLSFDTVPHLVIAHRAADGPNGADTRAELSVRDTAPVLFANIYPVRITTESGTHWRTLEVSQGSGEATWDFLEPVLDVELDPQEWLIWRGEESPPATLRIVSVSPSVMSDETTITVHLEDDSNLTFAVYDVRGRRVAYQDMGAVSGSLVDDIDFTWNGRDTAGRRLPSGTYWIKLEGAGREAVSRLTIVH